MKNTTVITEAARARVAIENGDTVTAFQILLALTEEAKKEEMREASKGRGILAVHKAAEKILKNSQSAFGSQYDGVLSLAFADDKGVLICENACVVEFKLESAPSLPQVPQEKMASYPADGLRRKFSRTDGAPLTLPTVAELKSLIAAKKAERKAAKSEEKYIYTTLSTESGEVIWLDAERLLTMLCALPSCTAREGAPCGKYTSVYFEAENGRGLLLPCRPPKNVE